MEDLSECMDRYAALYFPRKNGKAYFEHCRVVEEATGEWPEAFPLPEVPEAGEEIWDWYWDLRDRAGGGFSGPEPLKYSEIDAWLRLNRHDLSVLELDMLKQLDDSFMANYHKLKEK